MARQNRTFSDRQSGRLQRLRVTAHAIPAVPADTVPATLPSPGEAVDLGEHGTCTVLAHEPGPGGITMVRLRCTKAGRRTTPGDQFGLSEPLVRRLLTGARQHNLEEQLSRFWGMAARELAELGPATWLPFLGWFLTVAEEQLPPPEEAQRHEGPIAELHTLHGRVMRGFHAQPRSGSVVTFTITLGRNGITVTDDLPLDDLRKIAQTIHGETDGDSAWRSYRSFVSDSIVRSVEITRRLVHHAVEKQGRWLRTRKLLDQQRFTRSSPGLLTACDASSSLVKALCRSIGAIRVGDRELEFEALFTASDFERERVVVVLAEAITALGCNDSKRLTLDRERELRERADAVLNEGMPAYLRKPMSDDRFRTYLTLAAAQAKPTAAAIAAAQRAFAAEAEEIRTCFREHTWRYDAVATALGITPTQLAHRIHHRHAAHELGDAILDDRRAFVLRIYRKAVPGATTAANMEFAGIRAVANAIGVEPATPVGLGQHVQDWVRDALIAGDAPQGDRIPKTEVEAALRKRHGYGGEWCAAQELGIRIATLHRLIAKHGLDHLIAHHDEW